MDIPPLCIIQARWHSTRLMGKMLLTINGETLIARAWRVACEAFGKENCVVAIPYEDKDSPLFTELRRINAFVFWPNEYCPQIAVLIRVGLIARVLRWHPDSVIVRYTPDDHRKDVKSLRRVAAGERLPVEQGGEAFTLLQLNKAIWGFHQQESAFYQSQADNFGYASVPGPDWQKCEHITYALFDSPPPPAPNDGTVWTIDTPEDYARALNGNRRTSL